MKTLILQLARLGDIYSTWPSIRALSREDDNRKIDVMVRARFEPALEGLEPVENCQVLPIADLFTTLLDESLADEEALFVGLEKLRTYVDQLKQENYDEIINLSFSPTSSFLVKLLETDTTVVKGYTRQADGFLKIPDDASAYFYGQMGVNSSNRFHVNDMFSEICEVELKPEDYHQTVSHELPPLVESTLGEEPFVVYHIGASDPRKSLNKLKTINLLKRFVSQRPERVVLIGSPSELPLASEIADATGGNKVTNMVGKTKLIDLFPIIRRAKLVIGADSSPIHIASLVATPVYNLSNSMVRFWETGPKAAGSRIRVVVDFDFLGTDQMMEDINAVLEDDVASDELVVVGGPCEAYQYVDAEAGDEFRWKFIEAIYLGKDFPVPRDLNFVEGARQIQELNALSLQQFHAILTKEQHQENMTILENVDNLVDKIIDVVPDLEPLVKWYQTEKLRVGPGDKDIIVERYTEIHETLAKILAIYLGDELAEIETEEMPNEHQATK